MSAGTEETPSFYDPPSWELRFRRIYCSFLPASMDQAFVLKTERNKHPTFLLLLLCFLRGLQYSFQGPWSKFSEPHKDVEITDAGTWLLERV